MPQSPSADPSPGDHPARPTAGEVTRAALKTPKAAAIAGIVFSLLLLAIFGLLRSAVPADPLERGIWLITDRGQVGLALNLVPFAGIAFLWFIGVLRDRLGAQEDRFFATVFFGSALLLLATIFVTAAMIGALLLASSVTPADVLVNSPTFTFARATIYILVSVYAHKLAGVFLFTTSTVVIVTRIAPRWIALLGYALAVIVLFGSYFISWSFMVLPIWVLLMSIHIVMETFRRPV
ncbi:MFS family permease [Angulomicrobium tetraedrale]|uniref:MFS family permease n=1 Tax=Ancylobacter tetraedralis TaxID=217068 RepID=A0A839ZFJ0_9HYPH|nr:hypothetical protein [Ancylobacter tetraedralis]MBB3773438.1 MFS family permease [Ancylobacter tetraedralis]